MSCGLDRLLQLLKSRNTLMADKDVAEDIENLEKVILFAFLT